MKIAEIKKYYVTFIFMLPVFCVSTTKASAETLGCASSRRIAHDNSFKFSTKKLAGIIVEGGLLIPGVKVEDYNNLIKKHGLKIYIHIKDGGEILECVDASDKAKYKMKIHNIKLR